MKKKKALKNKTILPAKTSPVNQLLHDMFYDFMFTKKTTYVYVFVPIVEAGRTVSSVAVVLLHR